MMLDLEPPAARIAEMTRNLPDDRLADPTPCGVYTVRILLEHLVGLTVAFHDAGRKELGASTGTAPATPFPPLDPDWRAVLARRLDELVATWRRPESWEGETQAGGITLPAQVAGLVAQNELLVHGWDLARALGLDYAVPAANLEASRSLLAPAADEPDVSGAFGTPVEVPEDAPLLHRVLGLAGRDPSWTPPGA
ncbi:TIGR03086 family metal-binding protein [Streptomyces sp. SID3343]|uniref:TIGR03086 family metal-binding protein n=1 Tax=Streptomyces sp. SID3343 TaxID=2690260 RepID=UPI00136CDD9E|nr:TIGR03086 family metal-binding protein [Streptomyces sp. SID3343]MYW05289.1 TIGR03086 family protein [Streptomyces sp. SID3343]